MDDHELTNLDDGFTALNGADLSRIVEAQLARLREQQQQESA